MTNLKAIIFDLDGVLTDTAEYHFLAWQRMFGEEGIPFTREDNEALRGISRRESLQLILGSRSIPQEKQEEMMATKNKYYQNYIQEMTHEDLLCGALDIVQEVQQQGLHLALASASKNAGLVLEKLGITHHFEVIADGHSVEHTKPAPDLFLFVARALNLPPSACAVVEDARAGIDAALAANMLAIGIGPEERVGHAHYIYPSVAHMDLQAILNHS